MGERSNGRNGTPSILLPQHPADLKKSGPSDETIAACGFRSVYWKEAGELLGWAHAPRKSGPFLAIPFFAADGSPLPYVRLKPDRPRREKADKDKFVKYESPRGKPNRAYFPPGTRAALADPAVPLLITEGEKKAAKADQEGFPCVGLVGVYGWQVGRKDKKGTRQLIPDLAAVAWARRTVCLAYDSDLGDKLEVQWAEWHLAQALEAQGAALLAVRLPPAAGGSKVGLDDFLVAHGPDALRALLAQAVPPARPKDQRPEVLLQTQEDVSVKEAIEALAKRDRELYQRGLLLVRIAAPCRPKLARGLASSGGPRIEAVPAADLRIRLTRHANIVEYVSGENGEPVKVPAHPTPWLVAGVEAGGDAIKARDAMLEAVCDFPFAAKEHRAAWLAGLLTPLARFAFDGPAPLFLIDANVRGAGKGLPADVVARVASGRDFARAAYTADDDEMRKVITAIALQGEQLVLLDNLGGAFGNPCLDAALTATEWSGRILGKSQQPRLPLLASWFATGNNVVLQADTTRRVCHVRLDSPDKKPEERASFKHPDLLGWVRAHRGRLLAAALTILSAYCKAGRPDLRLKAWGSFEGWTALVRNAVVWVDMPDPGDTRQELASRSDRDAEALRGLLAGWPGIDPDGAGKTAAQAVNVLKDADPESHALLRETLADLFNLSARKLPPPAKLGYQLRRFRGRNVGGVCFDSRPGHGGVQMWFVRQAGRPEPVGGDGGDGGDDSPVPNSAEKCAPGVNGRVCASGKGTPGEIGRNCAPGKTSPPSPPSDPGAQQPPPPYVEGEI